MQLFQGFRFHIKRRRTKIHFHGMNDYLKYIISDLISINFNMLPFFRTAKLMTGNNIYQISCFLEGNFKTYHTLKSMPIVQNVLFRKRNIKKV